MNNLATLRKDLIMAVKMQTTKPSLPARMVPTKLPAKKIVSSQTTIRKDLRGITIQRAVDLSPISNDPLDYIYLIYGPKKVGKTKFSSLFGADEGTTEFMMFEKLARHLSIHQAPMVDTVDPVSGEMIPAWLYAEAYLDDIIRNPGNIRTICADGMLAMYEKAFAQGCKEGGFIHPGGQNDFGVSWDKIKTTFYRFVNKLVETEFGVLFNCHDIAIQHERFDGVKTQIVPNLPRYADEFVRHKIDNVFYFHIRGKGERWLQLRADETVYAACAPENNFLTLNGEPIWMIPMGNSAEQGYKNFLNAFHNKQTKTYKEVTEKDIAELEKQKGETTIRRVKDKRK
jgi:hypothetical protein